jgi:hypothetical protein
MRWCVISACVMLSGVFASFAEPVLVGPLNVKEPPSSKELVEPKSDKDIDTVSLRAAIAGEVGEHGKSNIYVLVNPLSNPETRNVWWVQESVIIRDGKFKNSSQFGEGSVGKGDYFAIVALATDKKFDVGQELHGGLPKANGYSKLKIVKRKD